MKCKSQKIIIRKKSQGGLADDSSHKKNFKKREKKKSKDERERERDDFFFKVRLQLRPASVGCRANTDALSNRLPVRRMGGVGRGAGWAEAAE